MPKIIEKRKLEELKKRKENQSEKSNKSTIAWRYDHMKIKFKAFAARSDYLFLDLSKNINLTTPKKGDETTAAIDNSHLKELLTFENLEGFSSLRKLYNSIESNMQNVLESPNDVNAKRFVVNNFGSFISNELYESSKETKASICQFFNA